MSEDPEVDDTSSHRLVDHTGELQLELMAPTRSGILEEATIAYGELVSEGREGVLVRRPIVVPATDDAALLAAWLEELVFLGETEGLVPHHVDGLEVDGHTARGTVVGKRGVPRQLVKAATYHALDLSFDGSRWHGQVVLDV
jgi:SHS2 domain-containing protein